MKISYLKLTILALFLITLQISVLNLMKFNNTYIAGDLLVALLVALIFIIDEQQAMTVGWIIGIIKDLFATGSFGFYALSFCLLAIALVNLKRIIYVNHIVRLMICGLLMVIIVEYSMLAFEILKGDYQAKAFADFTVIILLSGLITGLITPFIAFLLKKTHKIIKSDSI